MHEQVAGLRAASPRISVAGDPQLRAFRNPRRNFHRHRILHPLATFTATGGTRLLRHFPGPSATCAGLTVLNHSEEGLRGGHRLARSSTLGTFDEVRPLRGTLTIAFRTRRRSLEDDLPTHTGHRFKKIDLDADLTIRAALGRLAAPARTPTEEAPEEIREIESVLESLKTREIESAESPRSSSLPRSRHSELIVPTPLGRIGEHFIGLIHLLELLFRLFIPLMLIRMQLFAQAAVRLLDVFGRSIASDAEHLVIIAWHVAE